MFGTSQPGYTAKTSEIRGWLSAQFGEVYNRRRFIAQDESEDVPGEFVIKYRDHSWVISVVNSGSEILVRMPRTHQDDVDLGRFPYPNPLLNLQIMTVIDPQVSMDIIVSADGEAIVPPATATDEDLLGFVLTHKFCSGAVDNSQITEKLQACHGLVRWGGVVVVAGEV